MNPTKYQYTTPNDPIHPHNPDNPYDPYGPNNDTYVDDETEHIFGYMMLSAMLLWCFAITFNFTKSIGMIQPENQNTIKFDLSSSYPTNSSRASTLDEENILIILPGCLSAS